MCEVSIIIPIYNGEKYIKRCLDSVINQTYKNIEIICINDGSEDNSLKILKEYKDLDNRIVIIDKENAGVSSARNDGIMRSRGEYITFVDVDDWLELDAIESLYRTLIEKNVDVVRANYYRNFKYNINSSIGNLYELSNKLLSTNQDDFANLVIDRLLDGRIPCYVVLLLIKKEYILKTSLFRRDVQLMEDTIFYNELFSNISNIFFMDKPIYHYYCNENSCTKSCEYYIRNMYNIIKVNNYLKEIITNSKFNSDVRIKKMNTIHLNMIVNHIFMLFKSANFDKSDIINELDKLHNNEYMKEILENSNIQMLPIHLKIPIILAKKRRYNTLFVFYKLRFIMSKLKDIVTRRKE